MGITHRMMFAQVSVTTVLVCALNVHQGASAPQYQYTYQGAGSSGYTYDISNPKPFNYKYNGNDLNYNFEYNANNNNNRNNLNYNYQYDGSNNNNLPSFNYQYTGPNTYSSNNIRTDVPADQLVGTAVGQVQEQGAKILEILGKLNSNPIITRALSSSENDPCSVSPANIENSAKRLIDGLSTYSPELTNVVAAVQEMKANENNPSAVLRSAGKAVADVEPLIPMFTRLFALSPNCQANTRVTRQADESSFDVCSGDTSEFTKNVFLGVGELMTVLKEISIEFNEEVSPRDVALIDNTAAVINDGVDILSDLELAPLARAVTFSKECPASLADVSRSLNQIADVVDVVGGNNFQRRAY